MYVRAPNPRYLSVLRCRECRECILIITSLVIISTLAIQLIAIPISQSCNYT